MEPNTKTEGSGVIPFVDVYYHNKDKDNVRIIYSTSSHDVVELDPKQLCGISMSLQIQSPSPEPSGEILLVKKTERENKITQLFGWIRLMMLVFSFWFAFHGLVGPISAIIITALSFPKLWMSSSIGLKFSIETSKEIRAHTHLLVLIWNVCYLAYSHSIEAVATTILVIIPPIVALRDYILPYFETATVITLLNPQKPIVVKFRGKNHLKEMLDAREKLFKIPHCREIASIAVGSYWTEYVFSAIVPRSLYNSKTARHFLRVFLTFILPLLLSLQVLIRFLPGITRVFVTAYTHIQLDLGLKAIKYAIKALLSRLLSVTIPQYFLDILDYLQNLATSVSELVVAILPVEGIAVFFLSKLDAFQTMATTLLRPFASLARPIQALKSVGSGILNALGSILSLIGNIGNLIFKLLGPLKAPVAAFFNIFSKVGSSLTKVLKKIASPILTLLKQCRTFFGNHLDRIINYLNQVIGHQKKPDSPPSPIPVVPDVDESVYKALRKSISSEDEINDESEHLHESISHLDLHELLSESIHKKRVDRVLKQLNGASESSSPDDSGVLESESDDSQNSIEGHVSSLVEGQSQDDRRDEDEDGVCLEDSGNPPDHEDMEQDVFAQTKCKEEINKEEGPVQTSSPLQSRSTSKISFKPL